MRPTLPALRLKLAVLGSGPSAFYFAHRILARLPPGRPHDEVHMYERLPVPYGLVRYGVAPDHPDVKNCINTFSKLGSDPRFRFFGNVAIDSPTPAPRSTLSLPLSAILPHYSHLALSHGALHPSPLRSVSGSATAPDRIPHGVYSAPEFVGWYNGHPYFSSDNLHERIFADLKRAKRVTIIGQGNVALDVARMLLKAPTPSLVDDLSCTDIPSRVLEALRAAPVERVTLVGRRGVGQVAFTAKEVREMMHLRNVAFGGVDPAHMAEAIEAGEAGAAAGNKEWRARKRILGLLEGGSNVAPGSPEAQREWALEFLQSPIAYKPREDDPSRVGSVRYSVNTLSAAASPPPANPAAKEEPVQPPRVLATPTGSEVEEPTDLVIESVGYRSEGVGPVPFDTARGVIKNVGGRVVDESGEWIPNVYSTGWAARGPVGVIAATMNDSYTAADMLLTDLLSPATPTASRTSHDSPVFLPPAPADGVPIELAGEAVEWDAWQRIHAEERRRGAEKGKAAEKILTVDEMLKVARA